MSEVATTEEIPTGKEKVEILLDELDQLAAYIPGYVAEVRRQPTAMRMAMLYRRVRTIKERVEAASKLINGVYNDLHTRDVPEAFEKEQVKSLTTTDGFRLTVNAKIYAGIKADMKGEAFEWLRGHELGHLIVETVNASALSSAAKSLMEMAKELPEEIFNVAVQNNMSQTKAK